MADPGKRLAENVAGPLFVDSTCIDCDTCRLLAPEVYGDGAETSFVARQPETDDERRRAATALLSCPTGSIGGAAKEDLRNALASLPLPVGRGVRYCGFTSADSFGASSWLVEDPRGNWLVDSPRFAAPIVRALEEAGGFTRIFLTHKDDVADAAAFAKRFGAERVIHARDRSAQPDAEILVSGDEPVELAPGFLAIPLPGHTAGSMALLTEGRIFSGDHLWRSRRKSSLVASRSACWFSWEEQTASMEKLLAHRIEAVFPGHGARCELPEEAMRREIAALVDRMRGGSA